MSDEANDVSREETIMIDMNPRMENPKEPEPRVPVYELTTFTDMRSREVMRFQQVPLKGGIVKQHLVIFRGRRYLQFREHPKGPLSPPQAFVFDFPDEKTLEECFDHFEQRMNEFFERKQREEEDRQRIIRAGSIPKIPLRPGPKH